MKFIVEWKTYEHLREDDIARSFEVFREWKPQGNYETFLGRVDGAGGLLIAEESTPENLAKDAQFMAAYGACRCTPALDIREFADIGQEAVRFRRAVG